MMKLCLLLLFLPLGLSADVFGAPARFALLHVATQEVLSADEQEFYQKLTSNRQRDFMAMSPSERSEAIALTHKWPAKEALARATDYDIKTLSADEQKLYARLSDQGKKIFLVLDLASSKQAISWSETMPADEAIKQALALEINTFSPEQIAFYQRLSADNQLIYLVLSDYTQEMLAYSSESLQDPNKAVAAARVKDVARLSLEQQEFYKALNDEASCVLFLSLTPEGRGMAVALTRGIDPNSAVDYLVAIES